MIYYNEHDPFAAAWLRELMADGVIPDGVVDERSIVDVQPAELRGYRQCHFFAGIAGWAEALRLAGWGDRPVWSGSVPCQPFSVAGKRKGADDERHLWPVWFRLIRECRPDVVFGEQVEGAIRYGWLDGVQSDLEAEDYAVGHCVLGAHSAGGPHIRQRLFWVADADCERRQRIDSLLQQRRPDEGGDEVAGGGGDGRLADAISDRIRLPGCRETGGETAGVPGSTWQRERLRPDSLADCRCERGRLGDPIGSRLEGHAGHGDDGDEPGRDGADSTGSTAETSDAGGLGDAGSSQRAWQSISDAATATDARRTGERSRGAGGTGGFWDDHEIIHCRDGKIRRIPRQAQPRVLPVVDGLPAGMDDVRIACEGRFPLAGKIPNRTGILKGAGNAIVPQVAAEFIKAFMETER